jgi:hypothetical protein
MPTAKARHSAALLISSWFEKKIIWPTTLRFCAVRLTAISFKIGLIDFVHDHRCLTEENMFN